MNKHLFYPLLMLAVFWTACSNKDENTTSPPRTQSYTCLGCHGDQATLKLVAAPNPPSTGGEGGCGGTLPEMEAWEKVYVGGTYGQQFLLSTHGKIACVDCHKGVEPASDKTAAHTGNFVASPSREPVTFCGTCHAGIAATDSTSIHTQGFGQKAMVSLRSGFPSYENYPAQLKHGYDKNCGKCHSSCGECHIMRPRQAGGGFIAGHKFQKTPDMRLNCTACHSARVAHAYFGESFGTRPDVHYVKLPGGSCLNCHTGAEMHGTGTRFDQRYSVTNQPKCEQCHANKSASNSYHAKHWNDLACQTCHSQEYQNCGSCHVDTGVRNGPYMGFKIGMNAMPAVKRFKYVVLRNAPYAPDTWSAYGIPTMSNFSAAPTFKLATPHNIQRFTERTTVENGKPCYDACHIVDGRNRKWFLFQEDLQAWEVQANAPVIVDGHLPQSWK